jgi:hypothetical protein
MLSSLLLFSKAAGAEAGPIWYRWAVSEVCPQVCYSRNIGTCRVYITIFCLYNHIFLARHGPGSGEE